MGVLLDKSLKPTDEILASTIGSTYKLWIEIRDSIAKEYGPVVEEWKHYGAKAGWTLKLLLKKRNLFFLGPYDKYFLIAFVFGDRAVAEVEKSDLPPAIIKELVNAQKYAEGRGVRVEVKKKGDVKTILALVKIKAAY